MTASRRTRRSFSSLDDPAFGDELQRRIWMESYVAAYEVAILAACAVAAAMVWIGGRPLLWWAMAVIWIIGLGNLTALAHLRAAGLADLPWRDRMRFWSFRIRLVLIAVLVAGVVRVLAGDSGRAPQGLDASTAAGMVVGASVAIGAMALLDRRTRRRAEALPDDDRFDG